MLLKAESVEHLLREHCRVTLFLALLHRCQTLHLSWAPHLIGVELIRASVFVTVGLLGDAGEQRVARLEAELLVPRVVRGVAARLESILQERHF